jgi:4-hydroxybenzoate polyprenyltransferase
VGAVALLAGGDATTALRLGIAMTALQSSIGALNDVIDAPTDAGRKPGKPIPAGLIGAGTARAIVVSAAVVGVALSIASGPFLAILALVILAIGSGYDAWFKGTAWSWLPFSVGIPLLPVFGWLGVTGGVPISFAILVPIAVVGGAALAIANARADTERDAAAGVESVALRLGERRSWAVNAGLLVAVVGTAVVTLAMTGEAAAWTRALALGAGVVIGAGIVLGWTGGSARRERAWELEAVGLGLLAVAWLAGIRTGG